MRQLKLDIEALEVESFATGQGGHRLGTVRGHQDAFAAAVVTAPAEPASWPEGTCVDTCTTAYTLPNTCMWTCNDNTCMSCNSGPCDPRCQPVTD